MKMPSLKTLLAAAVASIAASAVVYAATATYQIGASAVNGGILQIFGTTSGFVSIAVPATAGSNTLTLPAGTTDFSATGPGVLQQASSGAAITVGAAPATSVPTPGTSITLVAPHGYAICTGTCTITIPVPAAGYEFCIRNDNNVATVITVSNPGTSTQFEKTTYTSYGTATTGTAVSGGAAGDKICFVGRDSTHYLVYSFNGTWTMSALDILARQIAG